MTDTPFPGAGAPSPHPEIVPELHETFARFKQAVLDDELDVLDGLLTGEAVAHGKTLRDAVLYADKVTLSGKDTYSKACVLGFRASFDRESLEGLGYQGYFSYALSFFPGGRQFLEALFLGNLVAAKGDKGEFVAAQLLLEGQPQDLAVHFYPDQGGWTIDPVAILVLYAHLTATLVEHKFDGDDTAFLEAFINDVFKPDDYDSCWEPVSPKT